MSNDLSTELKAQIFGQTSGDPLLTLITLSHDDFSTIYLVDNTVDIVSRGNTYLAFPMYITPPSDDGEAEREATIEFDNVTLELIEELRTVTTPISVIIETILASDLDTVQTDIQDLKLRNITYSKQRINAKLYMDSFLNVELNNERYVPNIYPGIF